MANPVRGVFDPIPCGLHVHSDIFSLKSFAEVVKRVRKESESNGDNSLELGQSEDSRCLEGRVMLRPRNTFCVLRTRLLAWEGRWCRGSQPLLRSQEQVLLLAVSALLF